MSGARLRVGVLGAGTVGREVVRALLVRPDDLRASDGATIELTAVAVRDPARAAAAGVPTELLSDAPAHLVADDEIDVIVELMGGDEPAHTLIAAALSMGKSVVTANKHVIAHHGPELETIARRTGAALRFEAAVGGGIPVLGPLATDLAGNRVTRVRGIVNGTTNFILSAMTDEDDPVEFAAALAEAQRLGYAEADRRVTSGHDAVNKLHPRATGVRPVAGPGDPPDASRRCRWPAGPHRDGEPGDQVHARAAGGSFGSWPRPSPTLTAPCTLPCSPLRPARVRARAHRGVRNRIEIGDAGRTRRLRRPGAGGPLPHRRSSAT
jgi:hypothetical protein